MSNPAEKIREYEFLKPKIIKQLYLEKVGLLLVFASGVVKGVGTREVIICLKSLTSSHGS